MIPRFNENQLNKSYAASRDEYKKNLSFYKDQRKILSEEEAKSISLYNSISTRDIREHLDVIDYNRLEHLLQGKFYNPKIMYLFSRILVAIYSKENADDLNIKSIHTWLKDTKKLSEGVFGLTMEATLKGMLSPEVVIKYAKTQNLSHEIFVGLYGTNRLRIFIPNFSFVYGGFSCDAPLIVDNKLIAYCEKPSGKEFDYALYEDITPSLTFAKALENLPTKEILNLYF